VDYKQSVSKILQKIHLEEQEGQKLPQEPLEKIIITKVKTQYIDNAKSMGIDIKGYYHEISNYFIRHVLKNHGNERKESGRGNLPVKDDDFLQIPVIIESPDYIIYGAKRNNEKRIIYIKHIEDGTIFYFEEILTGKNNKTLRGNTMYKSKKILNEAGIIANISINRKTDISKIKITGMDGRQIHQYSQSRLTKRQLLPFSVPVSEHTRYLKYAAFFPYCQVP